MERGVFARFRFNDLKEAARVCGGCGRVSPMGFLSCTSPAINRRRNKSKPQRNYGVSRPQRSTRSVRRASGFVQVA
jgi:hypothetical protein